MFFGTILLLALLPLSSPTTPPLTLFENSETSSLHRPTIHQSAIQARRLLQLSSIATLSTLFPPVATAPHASVAGAPIGLTDYYASCAPWPYDPTLLAVSLATAFRNAAAGSNLSLSLRWHPPADRPPSRDEYAYVPANMPRLALLGHLEHLADDDVAAHNVSGCFFERHREARLWAPGNDIHESWWARLVVDEVYWFGGFGDRAYIGWIPAEMWRAVTREEVDACRLVGEKGYRNGDEQEFQLVEEDEEGYQSEGERLEKLDMARSVEQELR